MDTLGRKRHAAGRVSHFLKSIHHWGLIEYASQVLLRSVCQIERSHEAVVLGFEEL